MSPRAGPGLIERVARDAGAARSTALVWIDAREAIVVRWDDGRPDVARLTSTVPPHHRSTGHVRHDPTIRLGGGGPQYADEPRRLEHLAQFMSVVEAGLPMNDDLYVIGPGVVHEQLAERLRERDRRSGSARTIRCESAARLTDRQLVARLRQLVGAAPRRRMPSGRLTVRASVGTAAVRGMERAEG